MALTFDPAHPQCDIITRSQLPEKQEVEDQPQAASPQTVDGSEEGAGLHSWSPLIGRLQDLQLQSQHALLLMVRVLSGCQVKIKTLWTWLHSGR